MSTSPPHALILPYPAGGHITPLMELSYCLMEQYGFNITLINTEFNHVRVVSAMPETKTNGSRIRLATIPDGLEAKEDRNNLGRLTESITTVMPGCLEELMKSEKFTCFIADVNMSWSLGVAKKMGLRTAAFCPSSAGVLATILSIPKLMEDGIISEDGETMNKEVIQLSPGMVPIDVTNIPWSCFHDSYTEKILFNYFFSINKAVSDAESIICNSFFELEKPVFRYAPNILPVGPLLSGSRFRGEHVCHFWPEDKTCAAWLDKQPLGSVVYVAFGSTAIFSQTQFEELALGLELAGRPFLWVVRPDFSDTSSSGCAYPAGFEERVAGRGRMVGWSPQHKVLQHPAIACFITHCGWNSTMEGVRNGVPFLCWPYFGDQLFNQSYITDIWKVGLRMVPNENGVISKEQVGSKVEELFGDADIRERSLALKKIAQRSVEEGGSSFENFNKFADSLRGV